MRAGPELPRRADEGLGSRGGGLGLGGGGGGLGGWDRVASPAAAAARVARLPAWAAAGATTGTRGRVTFGSVTVVGVADYEAIGRTLRRMEGPLLYCYESQLSRSPDLAGTYEVQLKIEPDGTVASTRRKDSSTLVSDRVDGCIQRVLIRSRFAPPGGDQTLIVGQELVFDQPPRERPARSPLETIPRTPDLDTPAVVLNLRSS